MVNTAPVIVAGNLPQAQTVAPTVAPEVRMPAPTVPAPTVSLSGINPDAMAQVMRHMQRSRGQQLQRLEGPVVTTPSSPAALPSLVAASNDASQALGVVDPTLALGDVSQQATGAGAPAAPGTTHFQPPPDSPPENALALSDLVPATGVADSPVHGHAGAGAGAPPDVGHAGAANLIPVDAVGDGDPEAPLAIDAGAPVDGAVGAGDPPAAGLHDPDARSDSSSD